MAIATPEDATPDQGHWLAAYTAGLFDGEGYIGILRSRRPSRYANDSYTILCTIGMTDREAIDRLCARWGGHVRDKRVLKSGKRLYDWSLKGSTAVPFLTAITPYLCIKRQRAELALEFQATIEPYVMPKGRVGFVPLKAEIIALREGYYQRYRTLTGAASQELGC